MKDLNIQQEIILGLTVFDLLILCILIFVTSLVIGLILAYISVWFEFRGNTKKLKIKSRKLLNHLNKEVTTFYDFLKYYG